MNALRLVLERERCIELVEVECRIFVSRRRISRGVPPSRRNRAICDWVQGIDNVVNIQRNFRKVESHIKRIEKQLPRNLQDYLVMKSARKTDNKRLKLFWEAFTTWHTYMRKYMFKHWGQKMAVQPCGCTSPITLIRLCASSRITRVWHPRMGREF